MDCKCAKDLINLYVDNLLGDAEKKRLVLHVQSCDICKKELNDTLLLKKAFANIGEVNPPAGLGLSAIKKAKKSKLPIFAYASIGIAAAAALIIVFSSGIILNMNNSMSEGAAEERAVFSEPRNEAAAKDEDAGFFEQTLEEAVEFEAMPAAEEADMAAAPDMAEDSIAFEEAMPAEEPMEQAIADMCIFIFSGVDADIYGQIMDAFIEDYSIIADYWEFDSGRVISFVLNEESFAAFEALVIEADIPYEGELSVGCIIEMTFIE